MIKKLANWLLPTGVLELRRKYLWKKSVGRTWFPENEKLKNSEAGKRCFILATGPSINQENLLPLKNELCISTSNFFLHKDYDTVCPKYHVLAASHPPITAEQYQNFLSDATSRMKWQTKLFMSVTDKDNLEAIDYSEKVEPCFYRMGGDFPINLVKALPDYRTVVHPAIYLAAYLGVKEIYLLGVDHSWAFHYGESRHFYEEKQSKLVQQNYNEWRHSDIGKLFLGYSKTWDVYRRLRDNLPDIKIINLNPDSVLDLFDKEKLEKVIS